MEIVDGVGTARVAGAVSAGVERPIGIPIPALDLQADALILQSAYEALHPGLMRYNSPEQIADAFRVLSTTFQQDRTRAAAFVAFAVLVARLRCGHSYPSFANQPRAIQDELLKGPRIPFCFRWLDERMIVTRAFDRHSQLQPGTEILAINGTPVRVILRRLMSVARADGGNDSQRISDLEVRGEVTFEAFDIYLPLFFPWGGAALDLTVYDRDQGRRRMLRAAPMSYAERLVALPQSAGVRDPDEPLWSLSWPAGGVGRLTMPTWATHNSNWDWRADLERSFAALADAGARALIIDLRGNEGRSDSVGRALLAHLTNRPLQLDSFQRKVRYRKVPERLLPNLSTWDPAFYNLGVEALDCHDGFFRLSRPDSGMAEGSVPPAQHRFQGRVIVLTGAANSSATFQFALAVRQHGLATLVGQATGGNQRGINAGALCFLRLPHSQIEIDLPLIGYFPEGSRPDAGVAPDLPVAPTLTDLTEGHDPELRAALALLG